MQLPRYFFSVFGAYLEKQEEILDFVTKSTTKVSVPNKAHIRFFVHISIHNEQIHF